MVAFKSFFAALVLSGVASALPRPQPDSAIGDEVAVSAPNGVLLSDTAALASRSSERQMMSSTASPMMTSSSMMMSQGAKQMETMKPMQTMMPKETMKMESMKMETMKAKETMKMETMKTKETMKMEEPMRQQTSYGSGKSNWGGSGYDDCVNQCLAKFGKAPAKYMPTATSGWGGSTGGKSNGATHTVIVAPSQGVLRYVPFAVNASVGDTVKFMWGANNHTVTKGSALTPCNKTADNAFASGIQNKDFVFTQVVNDTKPLYFYCAFPSHCQKGMFGIINPPSSFSAPTSVGSQMQLLAANNSNIAAYAALTNNKTAGNDQASRWGTNIDLAAMPEWSHEFVAENVLYTRDFLASNSEVLKSDGSIDLSSAGSTPLMIPQDISNALNNAGAANASPAPSSSSSSSVSGSAAAASQTSKNGAASLTASRVFVGAAVVLVTFFAL